MKKRRNARTSAKPLRRVPLLVLILVTAFVAVGAATVISHRRTTAASSVSRNLVSTAATNGKKYVTVKVAGRDVQVDPQTGEIKPLTPQEAQQLADGLKTMLNRSTEGLVEEHRPDGSVSMDLQGRFQNVAVAKINADGTTTQSCIDNPEAAAAFFGIDPQLLGVEPKVQPVLQPTSVSPVKASRQ